MANSAITDLTALAETPATGDLVEIVDVSDTTMDAAGTNKKITRANLVGGLVANSLFDANTILAATTDDTPAALTVAEQRIVGRITGGNITALTATQIRTLINVEDGADVTDATNVAAAGAVMESDYDANTILAATSDNTPVALTVAEQTLVGRITAGSIDDLSATQVRTLLNVEDGADVTDATNVAAAGAVMEADTSTASMSFVVDEDDMSSDSATKVPTQQSVKAYVDASAGGGADLPVVNTSAHADMFGLPGYTRTGNGSQTVTADRLYYFPFYVPFAVRVTAGWTRVKTGAGTVARWGVVAADADWQPNSTGLIGQTTIDPSTGGAKDVTSLTWDLDAGLHLLLFVADAASVYERAQCTSPWVSNIARAGWVQATAYYYRDSVGTSAFSDPVPDWTTASIAAQSGLYMWQFLKWEAQP